MATMRSFNTTGPVVSADHYCIPPLDRLDLGDVLGLIRGKRYFVLHAPRQTGKTSALLALRDLLNSGAEGEYRCVYANVEAGQAGREDTGRAMRAILDELATRARLALGDGFVDSVWLDVLARSGPDAALRQVLIRWTQADPRPLVRTIRDGVVRIADYMDRCSAEAGHLVVFDRGDGAWSDKVFRRRAAAGGAEVHVWGM